jgi:hypothetical protein
VETPSADEVRARSKLLTQRYPSPAGAGDDEFSLLIEDGSALVASWTGRLIAPVETGAEVPDGLVGLAVRAIAKTVERGAVAGAVDVTEKTAGGRRLRSISAGPWSESYFAPGELSMKNGVATITGDPELDALLWALMTDDRRDEWMQLATGKNAPAGAVMEFDYRRAGSRRLGPGWGLGPDGF